MHFLEAQGPSCVVLSMCTARISRGDGVRYPWKLASGLLFVEWRLVRPTLISLGFQG